MGQPTPPDVRCPSCNAHVRHDAQWCTLCFVDLRPAPEPEPVVDVAAEPAGPPDRSAPDQGALAQPAPAAAGADPMLGWLSRTATATVAPAAAARLGRHARRPADTPAAALDGVDVEAMLAVLAAETDSGLGWLAGRLQTKGSKAVVIAGGIGAVCLVLFLVMAALGALL